MSARDDYPTLADTAERLHDRHTGEADEAMKALDEIDRLRTENEAIVYAWKLATS